MKELSPGERQAYLSDAKARYQAGIAAIDQVTNREAQTDVIRAGTAVAEANFRAAELALRLFDLERDS